MTARRQVMEGMPETQSYEQPADEKTVDGDYVFVERDDARGKTLDASSSQEGSLIKSNELVVIMVAGKVGNGKSTALNNIYGLNLETKSSSTMVTKDILSLDVEKNGVTVRVIDTPGLGSIDLKTESVVREMREVTKGHNYILLYCLGVKPSDILTETDKVIIRNLQQTLGVQVWQKCVLLLTFSDITREQEYPSAAQDEDYKDFLKEHAQQFQSILQEQSRTQIEVKTIFEYNSQEEREQQEASEAIVAIPVQKEKNYKHDILPGISHLYPEWTDAVILELMKKKDAKDRILPMIAIGGIQNNYVKILAGGAVGAVVGTGVGTVTGIVGGPLGMIAGAICGMVIGGTVGLPIYRIVEILKAKPQRISNA